MIQIIVIFILASIINSQKAFLFSSSVGYYNYRQNANVLYIYQQLKKYGFQDQKINLAFPENVACCQKNPLQGSVSFFDNDYTNINKDIKVDMKYYDINVQTIFNTLRIKYPPYTLNIKKLKLDNQPYFIYITGHGGDYYFKIRERQAIISQNFQHLFQDLAVRMPYMNLFLLSDSCSSITPFQGVMQDNFMALGSSSLGQKSLSYGYDRLLNFPKSDEFTYYLSQFLAQNDKLNPTIKQLSSYMDVTKLKVHSKFISKKQKNLRQNISQFLSPKYQIQEKKSTLQLPFQLLENN